jgi:hypothetical protein
VHRPRLHVLLLAAILAFAGIGAREFAAAWHYHAHAQVASTEPGHHHDHGDDEQPAPDGSGDCSICHAITGGFAPDLPSEPLIGLQPAHHAAPIVAAQPARLFAIPQRSTRGPPAFTTASKS